MHETLMELKNFGDTRYRMPQTWLNLRALGYVEHDMDRGYKITQRGIDNLDVINKNAKWKEKDLIKVVVSTLIPVPRFQQLFLYQQYTTFLGLINRSNSSKFVKFFLTDKGKEWLKEKANNMYNYKLSDDVRICLINYVTDVSILPIYLASNHEHVRNVAKKRYNELKGETK
jgi:hypothetical protein